MRLLVTALGSLSAPFVIKTIKDMKIESVGVDIHPKEWIATSKDVNYFHQVPMVSNSKKYKEEILELCKQYDIKLIIPLTDVEVDFFSNNQDEFLRNGITIGISRRNVIRIMRNKLKLFEAFKKSDITVIPTYTKDAYVENCNIFPCVAKKMDGRSSEGMFVLEDKSDLYRSELRKKDYIIQPHIKGHIIVADLLRNHNQQIFHVARKELIRTKNGAGIAVEIMNDEYLTKNIKYFCSIIDFQGCINIEFIKNGSKYYLMDVNPRFSAGVVFSNIAGYNFVKNHILYFLGRRVNALKNINYGAIITRKYVEVMV
jgi:carbamoyl-phosphate synthase large subunit